MAEFSIIADVSDFLIKKLKENLCPELIQSPETILLASPNDKNVNFQLGLYLYDMKEFSEYRQSEMIRGLNTQTRPPRPFTLYFMLYLNSKAQMAAGAQAEMRILGRAVQYLSDEPEISVLDAHMFEDAEPDENPSIALINISFDEKIKIWQALNTPFQMAVYFTVSPVLLSSRTKQDISRVTHIEVSADSKPKQS